MTDLVTNAQVAALLNQVLVRWNQRDEEFRNWLAGSATGGPNGDGRFPLTNASGQTFLVDCPALLSSTVNGPAVDAAEAAAAAALAQAEAEGSADQAETAAELVQAAREAVAQLKLEAQAFRNQAGSISAALQAQFTAIFDEINAIKAHVGMT